MAKKYNAHLIKLRKSYSIKDICLLFAIDRKTCSSWIRNKGLKVLEENMSPLLVMGIDLKDFIRKKRAKNQFTLKENEFLCLKCRKAVKPKIGTEKIVKTGKRIGKENREQLRKMGICEACGTKLNRYI